MMIPAHLRPFVVEQDYASYTPVNQAVWRYVMRQNLAFLESRAHPAYLAGLLASGISPERIPDVAHMNACLARFGWGAVTISGVIPATVFMDFQAHGLLPVSADIRTLEHLAYTPAPDILHETAGHAPILADPDYSRFVKAFGALGAKALSSRADREVYERTRALSILKEAPGVTSEAIAAAEAALEAAKAAVREPSEDTMLGRLYWWTVEYGLIGSPEAPAIYGAGLLSSVEESETCLRPEVPKLAFDLETVIATPFDITKPQPQLFVTPDFATLVSAVETMRARMALTRGGALGLARAEASGEVATVVLETGLQVSGRVERVIRDAAGRPAFFKLAGPAALAFEDRVLPGHGPAAHADGFSAPVGPLAGAPGPVSAWGAAAREAFGLVPGGAIDVRFESGLRLAGRVEGLDFAPSGALRLVRLQDARLTSGDETLYDPAWGPFDWAVGETVVSVHAGGADPAAMPEAWPQPSDTPVLVAPVTEAERPLHALYQAVRDHREGRSAADLEGLAGRLAVVAPRDWLLRLELLELAPAGSALAARLRAELEGLAADRPSIEPLVSQGLALLERPKASRA